MYRGEKWSNISIGLDTLDDAVLSRTKMGRLDSNDSGKIRSEHSEPEGEEDQYNNMFIAEDCSQSEKEEEAGEGDCKGICGGGDCKG